MNEHITKEQTHQVDRASELFGQNFLCSQALFAAFSDELGLSEEQALKIGACFGSGMCKGEVCGAATGALMVLGLKYGQCVPGPEGRMKTNSVTVEFLDRFSSENGSYMCRELLGCDISTEEGADYAKEHHLFGEVCPKMVASAASIVRDMCGEALEENKKV